MRNLTPREREVLLWICRGKTYAEAALILGISFSSIKTHLDVARYKINAVNLAHACALCVAFDILSRADVVHGHYPALEG